MSAGVPRVRELWVASAAFFAVVWAPIVTALREGPRGLVHYLAGDTLYYVTVAVRSHSAPHFTFDGELPTNGFHPLWQIVLTTLFGIFEPSKEAQIATAFVLGAVLVGLGTALLAVALLHLGRRPIVAVFAAVPGVYWLAWAHPHPELLSPWASINGMETPLSIAIFGGLAFLVFARGGLQLAAATPSAASRRAEIWIASLLLAGAVLARLDDVFLVGVFVVWAFLRSRGRRWEHAIALALLPALALAAWLAYCQWTVGTWFPLSGAAKASGLVGGLLRNGYAVLTTFLPVADIRDSGLGLWEGEAMRVVQMLVPAACALAFLVLVRPFGSLRDALRPPDEARTPREGQAEILGVLALYVLVKVGYNFAWVGLYHQGHWYFPIAFMALNLGAVWWAAPWLQRLPAPTTRWARAAAIAAAALLMAFSASVHAARKTQAEPMAIALDVWNHRDDLRRELDLHCEDCGLLSFDDATLAFVLDNRIANGLGLAADLELAQAMKRGEVLDLAWQRDLRVLATASYPFGVEAGDDPEEVRRALEGYVNLRGQSLEGWHFELGFVHEPTGTTFVHFRPNAPR